MNRIRILVIQYLRISVLKVLQFNEFRGHPTEIYIKLLQHGMFEIVISPYFHNRKKRVYLMGNNVGDLTTVAAVDCLRWYLVFGKGSLDKGPLHLPTALLSFLNLTSLFRII